MRSTFFALWSANAGISLVMVISLLSTMRLLSVSPGETETTWRRLRASAVRPIYWLALLRFVFVGKPGLRALEMSLWSLRAALVAGLVISVIVIMLPVPGR
jgi:hypothetical protein